MVPLVHTKGLTFDIENAMNGKGVVMFAHKDAIGIVYYDPAQFLFYLISYPSCSSQGEEKRFEYLGIIFSEDDPNSHVILERDLFGVFYHEYVFPWTDKRVGAYRPKHRFSGNNTFYRQYSESSRASVCVSDDSYVAIIKAVLDRQRPFRVRELLNGKLNAAEINAALAFWRDRGLMMLTAPWEIVRRDTFFEEAMEARDLLKFSS